VRRKFTVRRLGFRNLLALTCMRFMNGQSENGKSRHLAMPAQRSSNALAERLQRCSILMRKRFIQYESGVVFAGDFIAGLLVGSTASEVHQE